MSININHPNEDISTSAGSPPSLGSQAPLVANDATVTANSNGNIARWVMNTATGGASDSGYWANIASITFPATSNVRASYRFLVQAAGVYHPPSVEIAMDINQGASGLDSTSGIQVLNISNFGQDSIGHTNFMAVASAATNGTTVEIWMQKDDLYGIYSIHELARNEDAGISLGWNDGATWSASTPSGAVPVTSDWAGSGPLTSTSFSNGWAGTVYYEKEADGTVSVHINVTTIGTTVDGTTIFTMPSGFISSTTGIYHRVTLYADGVSGGTAGYLEMQPAGDIRIRAYVAGGSNWRAGTLNYKARG